MRNLVSRLNDFAQRGRHNLKMDLAVRDSSYRIMLQKRMSRYTEPADAESLRTAGHRLSMRHRLHSYTS